MKKQLFFFALFTCAVSFANGGAYYRSGNELTLITENSISVRKEILSLKRGHTDYLEVMIDYLHDFKYILTAANRWANRQIDDFTLNLSMSDYTNFYVNATFFSSADEWTIDGIGQKRDDHLTENHDSNSNTTAALETAGINEKIKKIKHEHPDVMMLGYHDYNEFLSFITNKTY